MISFKKDYVRGKCNIITWDQALIFWAAKGVDWTLSTKVDADSDDSEGMQDGDMKNDQGYFS